MSLKAIVFDFDGVIANSEPLHFQGYRDVLADQGITLTEDDYYARYRFADVFATVTRAPESVVGRVRDIPGIASAEYARR